MNKRAVPSSPSAGRRAVLGLAAGLISSPLAAQPEDAPTQVHLNGLMGAKAALLVIDGEPRTLQVGASALGVKLLSIEDQQAVVEIGGRRRTLAMGAAPVSIGKNNDSTSERTIVLSAGPGGHFTTLGSINGRTTEFLVDTGATLVGISQGEADRLGLRYTGGRRIMTQTANGYVPAHLFMISSLRIGDVEVRSVEAMIVPAAMTHVLLGNSFLSRFQMKRDSDTLTLERRF